MATEVFTNEASTTVSSGGTTAPAQGTQESWTVASSASFPAITAGQQFHVTDPASATTAAEIIAVTAVSGTTWTVTRGAEGTTPVAHTAGFTVQQVITAGFLNAAATANYGGLFGTGSDGAVVLDGTTTYPFASLAGSAYTITRVVFATSFTVNAGVTMHPNGLRIFCTGAFTSNGTISENGFDANGLGGGANSESPANELVVGGNGAGGGTGAGSQGSFFGEIVSGAGNCSGGAGGASGTGNAGGAANGTGGAVVQVLDNPLALINGYSFNTNQRWPSPGCGGSSGGGDGTNGGGGGGGGGGFVALWAHSFVNSGTVSATGGKGAPGTGGNAGGGGGGGGGIIIVYTLSAWTQGTMSVAGGTGGAGAGTGAAGSAGAVGLIKNVIVQ